MTYRILPVVLAAVLVMLPGTSADAAKRKQHHGSSGGDSSSAAAVPSTGTIHGTVRAGTKPLSHIAVQLVHKSRSAHTNKGGEFSFGNLKPGVYKLVAKTRHHGSARATLAVDAGKTTDLVLPLRQPRRHHRSGGTATPGHTPGHTVGL